MAKTDRNSVVSLKNGGHLAGYGTTDASVGVASYYYPSGRYEFLESESDQHNISKKTVKQHTYLISKFPNRRNKNTKRKEIQLRK